MTNHKKYMLHMNKTVSLLVAALLLTPALKAQKTEDRVKNESIAAKYKDDNAVYTNYTEKLVISQDEYDGSLVANTYVTMNKLLISDLAPTTENMDVFDFSDFFQLRHVSCVSYIPDKKGGYKRVDDNSGFSLAGQVGGSFYDDERLVVAYYTALPKGTVTETRYTLENMDVTMLNGFSFGNQLPVAATKFIVEAPEFVHLDFAIKNKDNIAIKQDKEVRDGKTIYTFTANNLRPAKQYNLVPSSAYYVPRIMPYITSYRLPGAKKDSVILRDADALARHHFAYVKDLNIKLDTPLARIAEQITKNDKTDRQKAEHIYNWVQDHIHYIAFEKGLQGLVPRPADTVYKRMYGDCKDMASMCMGMCRHVGLKAYFATIGTRAIPYAIDEIPTQSCFNHMICAVKLGDEWLFLDGTDNTQPIGANRYDMQDKEAFIYIDAAHHNTVKIPVVPADKNTVTDSTFLRIDNKDLKGKVTQHATGYDAWEMTYVKKYVKGKDLDDMVRTRLMRGSDNFTQVKYELNTTNKGNKDAGLNATFTVGEYAHKVGKDYVVNMNLARTYKNLRMNDSERKVGYFFPYKEKVKEVVVLDIPEGYKVTHMPADAHGGMDGVWQYNISYKADKKQVVLTKEYQLQSLSLGADKFAANNKIVDQLNKEYKESVILTAKK